LVSGALRRLGCEAWSIGIAVPAASGLDKQEVIR
jgi:hypothetical protein